MFTRRVVFRERLIVTLLAAVVLVPWLAFALDVRRPLETYAVDVWREGLPQQMVTSVVQTSGGALWLGTFEGLVRFNGTDLTVFDRNTNPEIENWRIRTMCEGTPGVVWIGTVGGGLLRLENGKFRRFGVSDGLPSDSVSVLRRRSDGTLLIGTTAGIALMRGERIERIGSERTPVEAIFEEPNGTLLIGTPSGLSRMSGSLVTPIPLTAGPEHEPQVTAIGSTRSGDLWVGTRGEGLYRGRQGTFQRFDRIGAASHFWVTFIEEDPSGAVWIGLAPGGLARVIGERFELLEQKHGLPNSSVRSIFRDAEGSFWVGTNGGLARLKDLKFFNYTMRSGLSEGNLRVVLERGDGALWVGTYGGGVNLITTDGVRYFGPAEGLSDLYVRTIAEDREGRLWVGTGNGLSIIDGDRVRQFGAAEKFAARKVNAIHVTKEGGVIVATDEAPLQIFESGKFSTFEVDRPAEVRDARVFAEGRGGDLWIGTETHGLAHLRDGRIVGRWTKGEGLPSDAVFALLEGDGGDLWIGTHGGLALLRNDEIHTFERSGLDVATVFQIIDDHRGSAWLTSNHGVARVPWRELRDFASGRTTKVTPTVFDKHDGMAADQCNGASQPAGIRLRDGRLAIPTVEGLAMVDPENLRRNDVPPPVDLTKVVIDGRAIDTARSRELPWSSARFEFHYEGLSLLQPNRVTFRYRVEGFDEEWIEAGTRRVAFYNSLPPGQHVFRVQARNNDGVMSDGEARFEFHLPAPPWRRWWAIVLYLLVAALLVSTLIRLRLRVLRRKTELLESKVRERTLELEQINERLTQTSRELEVANERLAELSATDSLTTLANRRRFDQVLDTEWRRASRTGSDLSLLVIDVDHFKAFNDTYGHQAGDDCLRLVARTLRDSLNRVSDLVARYGGEEFAVLLPVTRSSEAQEIAERLRLAVERLGMAHGTSPTAPVVTVSIGVATATTTQFPVSADLVAQADSALYAAKARGRNRVHVSSPEPSGQRRAEALLP